MSPARSLRDCFLALPAEVQAETDLPPAQQVYVPPSHGRALSVETTLVLGGRGAGKTLWLRSLQEKTRREQVARAFDLPELLNTQVSVGFSTQNIDLATTPDSRTLDNLVQNRHEPYDIWSAVAVRAFAGNALPGNMSWKETVAWSAREGEQVARLLQEAENANSEHGVTQLLLFDGLETTAPRSWETTQELLRGLLMVVHEFRRYRTLRLKAFVRPDMLERKSIAFPDSSKLIRDAVRLEWAAVDLYGMAFQYVANGAGGEAFRSFAQNESGVRWGAGHDIHPVPKKLREDEDAQRRLFHALAGKAMGGGANRGDTWRWLPNHLADNSGYVSPRSFLAALNGAAKASDRRDPQAKSTALLWQSIQEGVTQASGIRVAELYEDFPWIAETITPLAGLAVPCEERDVLQCWEKHDTLKKVLEGEFERLPPIGVVRSEPATLILALLGIGLFSRRKDGRIDVPDIFRIEAKMPRRGGVPVRR